MKPRHHRSTPTQHHGVGLFSFPSVQKLSRTPSANSPASPSSPFLLPFDLLPTIPSTYLTHKCSCNGLQHSSIQSHDAGIYPIQSQDAEETASSAATAFALKSSRSHLCHHPPFRQVARQVSVLIFSISYFLLPLRFIFAIVRVHDFTIAL